MARGSARAGRDCVAFLLSLIPFSSSTSLNAGTSHHSSLPHPLHLSSGILPFCHWTLCFSLSPRDPPPLWNRTAPTASTGATSLHKRRLMLLSLLLELIQWRRLIQRVHIQPNSFHHDKSNLICNLPLAYFLA